MGKRSRWSLPHRDGGRTSPSSGWVPSRCVAVSNLSDHLMRNQGWEHKGPIYTSSAQSGVGGESSLSLSLSTVKCSRRPATAHQGSSPREQSRSRFPGPRCQQVPLTMLSFPSHQTVGQHQPGGHSTGERDLGRICVVWGNRSRCTRQTAEPSPRRPAKVPCLPFLEG